MKVQYTEPCAQYKMLGTRKEHINKKHGSNLKALLVYWGKADFLKLQIKLHKIRNIDYTFGCSLQYICFKKKLYRSINLEITFITQAPKYS